MDDLSYPEWRPCECAAHNLADAPAHLRGPVAPLHVDEVVVVLVLEAEDEVAVVSITGGGVAPPELEDDVRLECERCVMDEEPVVGVLLEWPHGVPCDRDNVGVVACYCVGVSRQYLYGCGS